MEYADGASFEMEVSGEDIENDIVNFATLDARDEVDMSEWEERWEREASQGAVEAAAPDQDGGVTAGNSPAAPSTPTAPSAPAVPSSAPEPQQVDLFKVGDRFAMRLGDDIVEAEVVDVDDMGNVTVQMQTGEGPLVHQFAPDALSQLVEEASSTAAEAAAPDQEAGTKESGVDILAEEEVYRHTPEEVWAALVAACNGNVGMARQIAESNANDHRTEAEKETKKAPNFKGMTTQQKIEAMNAREALISEHESAAEFWRDVIATGETPASSLNSDKKADAGETGKTEGLSWSDERAGNGEPFLISREGSIDLVDIPQEVFDRMGIAKAPFRLTPSMVVHVFERHKKELKLTSYEDAVEAVLDVMRNFDHVRQGRGNTYVFSVEGTRKNSARRAVTFVLEYDEGSWLGIKTVGYERISNLKELTTLWEKGEGGSSATGVAPANVSSAQSSQGNRTDGIASNQRAAISDGKGSDLSSDKQENGEESSEVEPGVVSDEVREKWQSARKVVGLGNEITVGGRKLRGHYVLVEAGAATPSHDWRNGWRKSKGYPMTKNGDSINDRNYERDRNAQAHTENDARNYDGRAYSSDVVVTRDGVVLSGNGRTMAGEIAARNGTDTAHNGYLAEYGARFGFSREQVEEFEHPRVLFELEEDLPYTTKTMSDFNQTQQKGQAREDLVEKYGKMLSDGALSRINRIISDFETMDEFYRNEKAVMEVLRILQGAHIIEERKTNEMWEGESISDEGRNLIEATLLGKVFSNNLDTARQLMRMPAQRNAVLKALPVLVANFALGDEFSFAREFTKAVQLVAEGIQGSYRYGSRVSEQVLETSMFGGEEAELSGIALNTEGMREFAVMFIADMINHRRSSLLAEVLGRYNELAAASASGQAELFSEGVPSRSEMVGRWKEALRLMERDRRREFDDRQTERERKTGKKSNEQYKPNYDVDYYEKIEQNGAASESDGGGGERTDGEDFGRGPQHGGESETDEETEASSLNGGKKADAAGTGTGSLNSGERGDGERDGVTFLDVVRTLYEKGKEFASGLFKRSFFDVAETPKFMKELGLTGDRFTIRFGVISRHFGKDSDHKLPLDVWQNLPEALQNPFAITRHFDRNGNKVKPKGFRIYTALRHNGKYVIVGADVKNIDRNLDINAIETAFAITNPSELEEIIYTSENITPEQLALLDRRNSDQYPASRENSDGKSSTLSSDKQEDGEKSSEERGESEENGGEEAERKAREAEEERQRREEEKARREAEREARLRELMGRELTEGEIDSAEGFDETIKNLAKGFLRGKKSALSTVAYNKIKEDVRNKQLESEGDSEVADGTHVGGTPDDVVPGGTGRGSGEGGGLDSEDDGEGGAERGPGGKNSAGVVASSAGAGGAVAVAGEAPGGESVDTGDGERRGGDRVGGSDVRDSGGESGGGKDAGDDGLHGGGTATLTAPEGAAPDQAGGKREERTGRGERTTEDVDRDLRDALGELGDILKGIGKGRANDITTVIAELIVKAPQLITAGCKVGYFLLERGFRQFKKWHARFKEVAGDKFRDAGLSDEVIDQLIEEFWNSPFAIDEEILTIAEWAEEMTREELRRAVSKSIGEKIEEQRKAEGIAVKIGDIANIRETLPFLLPQQHEDVEKAERQFFDPSHADREHGFGKGYMFTNGTGTGKTFTGLGIVKRFLKQGKGRVLIVTASEKKINDWISDAKKLGIEASMLEDTKTKGRGVVVTQYANMRQNDAILEDEFDLIVYDESHKLMENQTGSATATSEAHFLVSNRDVRSAITRSFRQHPVFQELRWKMSLLEDLQEISLRPKSELSERLKAIARNYRSEAELNNAVETTSLEIERLSEELERLIDEAMQNPEKVAAAEKAVARTKVVFLSATPFNTPRNLEYVEGYIFSYEGAGEGSGDFGHSPQHAEAGGTGASSLNSVKNGDGTERREEAGKERDRLRNNFLMRNFPSSHTYDKKGNVVRMADARIADAEKAGEEEVAFSDRLQNETETMSGRIIDSMYDYSREFPVMDTPIMPRFNQAISEIDNGKYSPLKEFFGHFFNDYNTMTAYMEAIKTSMVIDRVMEHIRLGRKVAVYHRRKSIKEDLTPPFDRGIRGVMSSDNARAKQLAAKFVQEFPDLFQWEQTVDFRLPVDQILSKLATEEDKRKFEEETIKWEGDVREAQAKKRKRIPKRPRLKVSGVGVFNGDIDIKEKEAYVDSFNDDDSDLNILVCQVASAKEGISLHDTTGKHQRVMVNLFLPQSPIEFIQTEGRIYRIGNRSDAIFEYPILGFNIELWSFINKINGRSQTSENLALGSMSRGLRNSIAASVRARRRIPVTENMGKGGKLLDSSANQNETDYDGAIKNYQEWKGAGTTGASSLNSDKKADAGGDGVEIPDPIGYVMVALGAANTGEHAVVPFASTGTIARYVPNSVRLTALEGDMGKFVDLAALVSGNGRTVLDTSLEKWHVSNKCDVIVMNAPHSRVRPEGNLSDVCQDEENIIRAFSHLEEGGRVVAIVARENMAEVERFVDNTNAAVMREVIAMPAFVLNGRESRIVVIDKISNEDLANEAKRYDSGQEKRDFSKAKTEDELFKAMRDVAGLKRFIDVKAKVRKRAQSGLNKAKTLPTVASRRDYSSGKMQPEVNDGVNSLHIGFKKGHFRVPERVGSDGTVSSYWNYFSLSYEKIADGDARYIMELCQSWEIYDRWANLRDEEDVKRLRLVDYRFTTPDKLGKTAEEVRATAKMLRDLIGNVLGKNEIQIRNMAKGVSENAIYGELSFKQYSEALRSLTGGNAEFEELNEKVLEAVGRIEGIQFRAKPGSSFGPGVLAHYNPFNNSIEINEGIFNSATVNDDMKRQTLLHEMIHAVTSYAMRIYESGRTDLLTQEQIEACQDIFEVYRQINNSEFAAQLQLKARGDANATYGLTSAYEMMAELSNPIFRSALKAKSLWRQLVNGIRRLLGMDVTGEGVESTALDVLNDALERLLSNFNGNAYREYLAAAQRQQGGTMEEDEDWLRIETDEMMVGDEVSEEGLGNKKTPFTGQPNRVNEKSASGSVPLSISGDSSSNATALKEAYAKLAKDSQSAKEKIRKFKNGDYEIRLNGLADTLRDLGKLLAMRAHGVSRYSVLKTKGGNTVAVRLSDHVANGENFRRDNADSNISIVIERRRFDVPTGEIVFTEAVIPMSVYEARPSDVVDAIVNGVDDVLNDKAFTLPSDMGTVEEKGGGPTEIELLEAPSDGVVSNSGEPVAMTSDSSITGTKLLKGVEKSYDKGKYLLEESEKSEDLTNDSDKGNNPRFREGGRRGGNDGGLTVEERKAAAERVAERVAGPLGVRVRVVAASEIEGEDEMSRRKRGAKGWFDSESGEVVVVADNHVNGADVEATVLHEVVGHKALREMIGEERFGEFLDGVYERASGRIRREIDRRVKEAGAFGHGPQHGGGSEAEARREAVEEYIAELAERGFVEFDGEEKSFWRQVVGWIRGLMTRMGLPMSRIGDNELRYMLWQSYQSMRGEGGYVGAVRDAEMRRRSGVVRFRSGSPVPGASTHATRAIVRARYDEMIRSAAYQVREAMQDSQLGLRRLMEQIAGKGTHIADIAGFENAYLFENRMGSTNLAEQHEYLNRFAKPLIAAVDELLRGVKGRKAKKRAYRELTEYMIAKHGLERNVKFAERDANAAVAADATGKTTFDDAYDKFRKRDYSGLTALTGQKDVEAAELMAQDMVDSYESSHDTSELWNRVRMASTASLEKTYRSGWISEDSFNEISAMFDYYIPLQGWDEKTSDEEYAYLHAFDSRFTGKPIRHAEGRRSLADDPLATLLRNADEAIRLGNRNIMKQRFLNFVLNHPSDAVAVNKVWFVHSDITGEWEPVFADLEENDTHDEVERKIRDFESTMERSRCGR